MSLCMFVVYDHPKDAPGHWVVRVWETTPSGTPMPAPCVHAFESLEEARAAIARTRAGPNLVRLPRDEQDDPSIAEVWL